MTFETVHTDDLNGFHIVLAFSPEHSAPDWDFDTVEDEEELLRRIENGTMLWFCARVEAYRHGVLLGTDYLGGCCYESAKDFMENGYYADMVDNAINEAKDKITELGAGYVAQ